MRWLQDHGWVVGLIVAAALAVAGLAWWAMRRRPPATPVPGAAARRRVDLTFAAAVVITLAVGWGAVLWLLGKADQVPAGKDRATVQADAIRTGATIALGTGGAAYLLLAYRRQRLDEVDTRERRITELYTKAVEQLGHEKAPVRLGALYSLERLAQNNPEHRQTVVDVFCAYLRMPYTLPARNKPRAEQVELAAPLADDRDQAPHPAPGRDPAEEELQVRQTAQRILAAHLHLPPGIFSEAARPRRPSSRRAFWPGISLDLTGAVLVDFDFELVSVVRAWFDRATFHGDAVVSGATFHGTAGFGGATFHGGAGFNRATFHGDAVFAGATFHSAAGFNRATFHGDAGFNRATFDGYASFGEATFHTGAWANGATFGGAVEFTKATFHGVAWFVEATFRGDANFAAMFVEATFHGDAAFNKTTFHGVAWFDRATFHDDARFDWATFNGDAKFERVTFHGVAWFVESTLQGAAVFGESTFHGAAGFGEATFQGAVFDGARVLHLDDPDLDKHRVWPDGCTVRPDPADPTRGMLVPAEQAEEPEPAVPPSDPTDNGSGTG